jgi:hypothetical protein
MLSAQFIPGGNPVEFVTTGPTKVSLPTVGVIGGVVQDNIAAATLTAADSGKTVFLKLAAGFITTLPLPAAGLSFEFIVGTAPSAGSYTIVTSGSANIIKGQVYTTDINSATDADFETSGGDTITLVTAKAVAGDRVELRCDGTNWFAYCFCSVFDAITITTAS